MHAQLLSTGSHWTPPTPLLRRHCRTHHTVQPQQLCHRSSRQSRGGPAASASNAKGAAVVQPEPVQAWRQVVAITAGCLLLCNLHRSTFAVLLPDLSSQLQLSASQAGAVQSAMLAAYLAGQVPAGRLADRLSAPAVLLCGCAVWSAATALTAAAGGGVGSAGLWPVLVLVVSRVLLGLASACAMPCVTAASSAWVPPGERASAIAFVYANFNIGGVAGLTLVPILAELVGGGGAFIISGAAGLLWAAVGAVMLSKLPPPPSAAAAVAPKDAGQQPTPAAQQQQSQHQQQQQPHQVSQQQQQQQQQRSFRLLGWRLDGPSLRQLVLLMYAHGVIGVGFFILQSFLPMYMASLGTAGLTVTGRLSSMPWLAAAVVGMLAGAAADGLIRRGMPTLLVRKAFQTVSFLGCGLSVLPLALSANPGLLQAVLCLTANLAFYSLSYGGFHAYLQEVAGKQAGVVQGLTNSASILCGIAGNLLTGAVVDATGEYCSVFWLLLAAYASAAVVWLAHSNVQPIVLE